MPISTIGQNGLNAPLSLTTPALGTPSSLVLTNATGLPQAGLGTGVAGNGPAFSAYSGTGTTVNASTNTKINFDTEEWDTASNFASSRFTPTVAGYYIITGAICGVFTGNSYPMIYKNGSEYKRGTQPQTSVSFVTYTVSATVYFNGSTDYAEIYFSNNSGSNVTTLAGSALSYFQAAMVRSA
jgi:hypothetical protein